MLHSNLSHQFELGLALLVLIDDSDNEYWCPVVDGRSVIRLVSSSSPLSEGPFLPDYGVGEFL